MLISKAVVNLLLGGPGSLGNVRLAGSVQDFRRVFVQVASEVNILGGLGRILCSHRNDNVFCGTSRVQHHLAIQLLCHPALDPHSVGRIHQGSLAVQTEGTGTGIEGLLAVLQDEETVALDGHVSGNTGGLEISLGEDSVDAGGHHAETDFLGIYTTNLCSGAGSSRKLLGNHVLKVHASPLESRCIYVGYVVADYIQTCLVILHTGYTGIK